MAKNLLSIKKKKRKARAPKSFDIKYLGTEPIWSDTEPTNTELSRAYNWYNYFNNHKDSIKLIEQAMSEMNEDNWNCLVGLVEDKEHIGNLSNSNLRRIGWME